MTVTREHPTRAQALERLPKRVFAYRLVHDWHALPAGQLTYFRRVVLPGVHHWMVATVSTRLLRLLIGAHRADYRRPKVPRPLAQDQAHAAGRGGDDHHIARLHPVGAA